VDLRERNPRCCTSLSSKERKRGGQEREQRRARKTLESDWREDNRERKGPVKGIVGRRQTSRRSEDRRGQANLRTRRQEPRGGHHRCPRRNRACCRRG